MKLAENLKALAGEALEASADDLEIAGGAVHVIGTDRAISFFALAQLPDAKSVSLPLMRSRRRRQPIPMGPISRRSKSIRQRERRKSPITP
jgi:hypothetical protein